MPGAKRLSQDSYGKAEFSASAITIPFGSRLRSMAKFEQCRLEWSWILIAKKGGDVRNFEFLEAP